MQLKSILSSTKYEDSISAIAEAKEMVMNKYNMFSIISHIIENIDASPFQKRK